MNLALMLALVVLGQKPQFPPGWGDGTYCGGYKQGYSMGWCSGEPGLCPTPAPRPCPPPVPGKSGYADGQYRGYTDGVNAKHRLPKAGSPKGM
jgi:hypothetical protein